MSNAAERSEIAVLQVQMKGVQSDVSELKTDVKEIKTLLLSSSDNAITRHEFEAYKKAQSNSALLKTIVTIIVTGVISAMAFALIVGKTR